VVVENGEGAAAELDAAMQGSIDASDDPWGEAIGPKTASPLASVLVAEDT